MFTLEMSSCCIVGFNVYTKDWSLWVWKSFVILLEKLEFERLMNYYAGLNYEEPTFYWIFLKTSTT